MTITPEEDNYALYGAYLIVAYQDPNTSEKKIYIDDGFDMLCSGEARSINNTEGTAYAGFSNVSTSALSMQKLLTYWPVPMKQVRANSSSIKMNHWILWKLQHNNADRFQCLQCNHALKSGLNTADLQKLYKWNQ